jgi:glycosyltransferase involved in cell wall biosynthesis
MATGRPIITTDVPGCRETVRPGENGWLVAERDSQALAAAAMRFARDPSQIPIMGAKSLELVRSRFDVRRVNVAMMEGMGL